jgi:zinc/manganese transport system substrate-binding protein
MKKLFTTLLIIHTALFASVQIDTTYSTLGAIAKRVGGDLVKVTVLGSNKYDPHFIVPKPSLIAKLRRADMLIINGGGLEIGWLPPLLRNAHNPKLNEGAVGFLDASQSVELIDKPATVSRAFGDVHAEGNPHYSTDPYTVVAIAQSIASRLAQIDPTHKFNYKQNLKKFTKEWSNYLTKLDATMAQCKVKEVVQYHELFNYFLQRYEIENVGTIEPLPGIAPSSKHTLELVMLMKQNKIKKILQDVYHEKKTAHFIASKTGAKVSVIPHDLGAVGGKTLEEFYNNIATKICN